MASRVKRAATSATRPAPLVMTTNWITTRIRNTTRPTTTLPPTTNVAERVDHLAGVAVQQDQPRDGDVEREPEQRRERAAATGRRSARARPACTATAARCVSAIARLTVISTSSSSAGSGSTIITTTSTTPIATARSACFRTRPIMPGAARRPVGLRRPLRSRPRQLAAGGAVDVGEHLGDAGEELGRDLLVDLDGLVERAGQRRVLDDRDVVLGRRSRGSAGRSGPGPWRRPSARTRRGRTAARRRSASGS